MKEKYKELVFLSVFVRIVAVVAMVVGVSFSLWSLVESERSGLSRASAILGIDISLVAGLGLYSVGELISLVLDLSVGEKGKGEDRD